MSEYTKGPWVFEDADKDGLTIYGRDPAGDTVVICSRKFHPYRVSEMRANFALLHAAPELLEVLQYLVAPFDGIEVVSDGLIAKARAAIEKAVAAPSAPIR